MVTLRQDKMGILLLSVSGKRLRQIEQHPPRTKKLCIQPHRSRIKDLDECKTQSPTNRLLRDNPQPFVGKTSRRVVRTSFPHKQHGSKHHVGTAAGRTLLLSNLISSSSRAGSPALHIDLSGLSNKHLYNRCGCSVISLLSYGSWLHEFARRNRQTVRNKPTVPIIRLQHPILARKLSLSERCSKYFHLSTDLELLTLYRPIVSR